jgi:hypothetical protein
MNQESREIESGEPAKRKSGKIYSSSRDQGPRKPWWLVFFIVFILVVSCVYIAWLNSSKSTRAVSFWAYIFGGRSESIAVEMIPEPIDSTSFSGIVPILTDSTFIDTSSSLDWGTEEAVPLPAPPSNRQAQKTPSVPDQANPAPEKKVENPSASGYYIFAGKFNSKGAALNRMRELRQGNYPARLIDTEAEAGIFTVSAGEYKEYNAALEQARIIGFILEIKTSVRKIE